MSDQHKGLIEAVKELLPYVEHMQCARHICQNLQKRFTVENEFSKSFNAVIVDARKKPIITMLEEIRLYMMDIVYNMKLKGQQWGNHICPEIRDKVNLLKKAQRHYQVLPSGLNQFEGRGAIDAYEVDLERKTCSCRLWQLNGYGCAHYVASISFLNRDVEAYVDNMFSTTTFRKAYNYRIAPMNSSDMWPETNYTPPLPPINRRTPGRPTTKRKKSTTENIGTHRVSKAGKKIRCSICKEIGHNKATCPQRRPQKLNVKKQKKQKVVQVNHNNMKRSYEGDEGVMGEEADVVEEAVVVEQVVQDEEAEEVDEVNHNAQVDNGNVQEVAPVNQVQQVCVRPISDILKRIRRRKSERILKLKLGKTIGGVDDPRNSKGKALVID
ncbi:uncharacterized protein LOC128132761 [Lactuca sativa]|uniref:uncharacterized protein LOC128132761 n=1 Tax=Lactuca sativa TaxID=4236 RepID=UPI0022AFB037|nr:uncharacterized protein LOC128132761 [Lactuca sativa]